MKLNIIDPWESGTESSMDIEIVKQKENQFLIFVKNDIMVGEEIAHYFICKLKNDEDSVAFKNYVKGSYEINMVFDKNINVEQQLIHDINFYRANFLTGEIII